MKLKDIVKICYGKNQKLVEVEHSDIPILGTGGIIGYSSKPLYEQESVLIGRKGTIAMPFYINKPFWAIDTLFYTQINTNIAIPKFLYYLLCTIGLKRYSEGAAVPSLTVKTLNDIELNIPSLKTQQHIVNIIGSIDDLIEKQNLKFDKIMNTSMIIFSSFESKHKCNFKEAFRSFNGGTFKSKFYVEESDYKLITIKNINDLGFDATKTAFLNKENANLKYKLSIGDILLTMTGNIGRSGIVDEENCYQNQRILKISCISQLYLLCYLNKYKNNIIQLGKGTAQLNLSLEDINNLTVFNSPKEISKFSKYDAIFDELLNIKLQIKKLKSIKKSLLNKYFTNQQ
ncbi:restriction endonuclease subunit S [Metamycoplasma hominis]|uniref:restriction endonuclease subunit S n=2 Tax=Metamycoplasma hominis TaxID=2098 RepID=UPI00068B3AC6|nr:restriction endonuclease subunit S [Metamycoplasma hominis]